MMNDKKENKGLYLEKLEEKLIEDHDTKSSGQKIQKYGHAYRHSTIESTSLYVSVFFAICFSIFIINKSPNKTYSSINDWSGCALASLFLFVFSSCIWSFMRISRKDMNASAYLIGAVAGAAASLALKHL